MLSKTTIKYIQSLRQKKFRDNDNLFIAEGPKVVGELLNEKNIVCKNIFATEYWMQDVKLDAYQTELVSVIADFELEKISLLSQPNKVFAVFEKIKQSGLADTGGKTTLVLDEIQDPGNFGTIIRTADWFGIQNIVCSKGCVDMYNPKVVQSTMSSIARVNIHYIELEQWLAAQHILKVAAVLDGSDMSNFEKSEAIIVLGNESKGISNEIIGICDDKISIAGRGGAESLNVAVAAGILLHHFCIK